ARRHFGARRCDGDRRLRGARREEPQPGSWGLRAADADRLSSLLRRLAARRQQHLAKVSASLGRVEQFARLHGGSDQEVSRKRRRNEYSRERPILSERRASGGRFVATGRAEGYAICIITGIWRWSSPIPTVGGTASA